MINTGGLRLNPPVHDKQPITCQRCGKPGHIAAHCAFKQAKCYVCGKVGHLSRVCKSKERGPR